MSQGLNEKHRNLLANTEPFVRLPPEALTKLSDCCQIESFPEDTVVIREGDPGDRLFIIMEGQAEVVVTGQRGTVPIATLSEGELFGEMALLTPGETRNATVRAITPIQAITISASLFHQLLAEHPALKTALAASVELLHIFRFLKLTASPFATLDSKRLQELAARLESLTVAPGEDVVKQGEMGDVAYLVRSGKLEAVQESEDKEKRLGTLRSGTLFGETALLTDTPRNATVRAVETSELLLLRRADLLEVMGTNQEVSRQLFELMQIRSRPLQTKGVIAYHSTTAEGEAFTTLKDTTRGQYFRLSPQGWFLWQRLDGKNTLRDLALELMIAFPKGFSPQIVQDVLGRLANAGFIQIPTLAQDIQTTVFKLSFTQRLLLATKSILAKNFYFEGVDPFITKLYRKLRFLYTLPIKILSAFIILGGLAAFFLIISETRIVLQEFVASPILLLFLIPANVVALLIHELGHALTVKAFRRKVSRVGIGWYWFSPIAFVDTSDMWLASRLPRIVVSAAGPYTNFVMGGIAALASFYTSNPTVMAVLWQFAFMQYMTGVSNLNPLLELDGYYMLMDWLERPNLRAHSLRWLGNGLLKALRTGQGLREHRIELIYGLSSVVYMVLMSVLIVILYRLTLQDWLAGILPASIAEGIAWLLAVLVVATIGGGLISDIKKTRASEKP